MGSFFAAFGIDWRLLVIQGINFGVLLFVLSRYLYKPIMKMIDDRRAKIAEGVRAAEEAKAKLADAQVASDGIVGNAAREAESLVASARTSAEARGAEIVSAADLKAQGVMKDANERAEESKRSALASSQKDIARAAMLAAEKIMLAGRSQGGGERGATQ